MNFLEIVKMNRSYRRFHEEKKIETRLLTELVDCARLSASAQNLQPLKYIIINEKSTAEKVFPYLKWAGYLLDWDGPAEGERPSAYVVILSDPEISKSVKWDHGIAAQTILLGAVSMGLGGCTIGSVNKEGLKGSLEIPRELEIELVIALGYPREKVVIDEVDKGQSIRYYRDDDGVHHVPKRKLDDVLIGI